MSLNPRSDRELLSALLDAPLNPRLAFLFPGQGVQRVGMGKDAFDVFYSAREVFSIADDAFGGPLGDLCFEGPQGRLTETENAQPAILATSVAYLAAAIESGALRERPAHLAGHSLGEYTALVFASAISLRQAVTLVRERGRLMSEAGRTNPGMMAALLGLDEATVRDICSESGAEAANFNGPTQTVIGGTGEAVEKASSIARARGGKVLPVVVSGAFHTSLMASAAESFSGHVTRAEIREPAMTVIGNVSAEPLAEVTQVRDDLAQQVAQPVQWTRTIRNMMENGVDTFVEIGPGRTLTGMLRRIAPQATALNIDSVESMSAALNV